MVNVPNSLLKKLEAAALSRRPRRKSKRKQKRAAQPRPALVLSAPQNAHAAALQRPFVAALPPPCIYSGEDGTINRFHLDATITTLGASAFIFHPNTGYGSTLNASNSATIITPTLASSVALTPGYNTLSSVASKVRAISSAIRFTIPSLSLTNVVGEFSCGVISADTVGTITTMDQLFTLGQGRSNVTRDLHEVRWYPNAYDARYSAFVNTGIASTGSDLTDTNCVFVVVRGIPPTTVVNFQVVNNVEWTAKANTGLMVSGSASVGTDHQHTVSILHKHTPGWFHTAKATGERLLEDTVGRVGKFAEKSAPKLVERGLEGLAAMMGL